MVFPFPLGFIRKTEVMNVNVTTFLFLRSVLKGASKCKCIKKGNLHWDLLFSSYFPLFLSFTYLCVCVCACVRACVCACVCVCVRVFTTVVGDTMIKLNYATSRSGRRITPNLNNKCLWRTKFG
jgi:hypothetical protein